MTPLGVHEGFSHLKVRDDTVGGGRDDTVGGGRDDTVGGDR